jgi:hypothetical protein
MLYRRSATRWPARMLGLAVITATALLLAVGTASAKTFDNLANITIPDAVANGTPATAVPSTINIAGETGPITKVTVTLHKFNHTCTSDVDAMVVGPTGQKAMLMSDGGDCTNAAHSDAELTFDDASAFDVPCNFTNHTPDLNAPLTGGTYKPTDYLLNQCSGDNTAEDTFPGANLGSGPFPHLLSVFNGGDANGAWRLFAVDQYKQSTGAIKGGWTLNITFAAPTVTAPGVSGTPQVGQTLTAIGGTIANGGSASFAWFRCDGSGTVCGGSPVGTGSTYTPVVADQGSTLKVIETVTNSGGTANATSAPTAIVAAANNIQVPNITKATLATSSTKTKQKVLSQGGLLASFSSNIDGNLVATATVSVPKLSKVYKFTTVKAKVVANNRTTVRLKLSKSGLKAVKKALGKHKKLKAKMKLTVTTASGAVTTVNKTITLAK